MAAGNVEAIRDWAKANFYTKDEVDDYFIKTGAGMVAYNLTIVDTPETEIVVVEDSLTNPQTYIFETGEDGLYNGLFFFHSGSTLTFNDGSGQGITYTLDNLVDTIYLSSPIIATPIMTSNTTPSGICRASSVYYQGGTSANWEPWHAFTQTPDLNGWAPLNNRKVGEWIEYKFDNPVIIIKYEYFNRNLSGADVAPPTRIAFLGSNDGNNYDFIGSIQITSQETSFSTSMNTYNIKPYKIYRTLIEEANNSRSYVAIGCINLYTPDIS